MRRMNILLLLLIVCLVTTMQAQTSAPKPSPEVKKLGVFVGHWTYEGEYKESPVGSAAKVTGESHAQMILGGFFFENRWSEKGPTGEVHGLEVIKYDPTSKNYPSSEYHDDGTAASGAYTVDGNTWAYAGKALVAGKQYMLKATLVCAANLMSFTVKGDISADGKTWSPFFEYRFAKVKPAPKKHEEGQI
jgi:hypothetical protein